jgi:DNA processing protein
MEEPHKPRSRPAREHQGRSWPSPHSRALDDHDVEALSRWQLSLVQGVGPRVCRRLIEHFGSAREVLAANFLQLRAVPGLPAATVRELLESPHAEWLTAEVRECRDEGVRVITELDAAYGPMLAEIPDPPVVLYVRGTLLPSDCLSLALVGTRHASLYGRRQAERLASSLSRAGLTIVSGLARGIDAAAHRATLAAGGRTLAIVAGGLLEIYPSEHQGLAGEIAESGAVISEMPLRFAPRRHAFPRRNRLISGLSLGTLVVEATLRSGALITARHAMEQGRDVFAVPGPVDQRTARGCHQLLRDGAKLVESADDVLEELGPLVQPVPDAQGELVCQVAELQLNAMERRVLQAISTESTRIEEVVVASGVAIQRVLATLSVLESRRLVDRIGGDRVVRRPR